MVVLDPRRDGGRARFERRAHALDATVLSLARARVARLAGWRRGEDVAVVDPQPRRRAAQLELAAELPRVADLARERAGGGGGRRAQEDAVVRRAAAPGEVAVERAQGAAARRGRLP